MCDNKIGLSKGWAIFHTPHENYFWENDTLIQFIIDPSVMENLVDHGCSQEPMITII